MFIALTKNTIAINVPNSSKLKNKHINNNNGLIKTDTNLAKIYDLFSIDLK
tara:strand:+ start:14333 stop:14485 length:153 start_codon:yes stop_codon:yes gene_type:complete